MGQRDSEADAGHARRRAGRLRRRAPRRGVWRRAGGRRPYGEGLPSEILKIAEDHDGDTYRCAYTVAFPGVAYVLDVFQKKSKRGVAAPQADNGRVLSRYKAAKADYEQRFAATTRGARGAAKGKSSP